MALLYVAHDVMMSTHKRTQAFVRVFGNVRADFEGPRSGLTFGLAPGTSALHAPCTAHERHHSSHCLC